MAWEAFLVVFRAWAPFRPQPWKKGRKREPKAIALYMSLLTADGHCPVLENRGVVIWKDFPVMGCSPDGVMSFDWECCTEKLVLLEVKCPTNLKNSFSGCRPKPLYMMQVQVAMGILNISSCDFFCLQIINRVETSDCWVRSKVLQHMRPLCTQIVLGIPFFPFEATCNLWADLSLLNHTDVEHYLDLWLFIDMLLLNLLYLLSGSTAYRGVVLWQGGV